MKNLLHDGPAHQGRKSSGGEIGREGLVRRAVVALVAVRAGVGGGAPRREGRHVSQRRRSRARLSHRESQRSACLYRKSQPSIWISTLQIESCHCSFLAHKLVVQPRDC
jgi:hypothetical protein